MILRVEGLSKSYPVFDSMWRRSLAALSLGLVPPRKNFQALNQVSFSLKSGQILGIAGPNGAGKSSLLAILAGALLADSGRITFTDSAGQHAAQPSVRAILELGTGFSPELNGYENAFYNGRLWNYTGAELKQGLPEIIDFAELRDQAHAALRTYSSGQEMRLAFALASFKRSDLILIDEAFAVGDARFQQKCIQRLRSYQEQGSIIILVSHSLELLRSLSSEMLLLDHGRILARGKPAAVLEEYMQLIAAGNQAPASSGPEHALKLCDTDGLEQQHFRSGESARAIFKLRADQAMDDLTLGLHVYDANGILVYGINSYLLEQAIHLPANRSVLISFALEMNLVPGVYSLGYSIHRGRAHGQDSFAWHDRCLSFQISGAEAIGLADLKARLLA